MSGAWNAIKAKILQNLAEVGIRAQIEAYPLNTLNDLVTATTGFTYLVGWQAGSGQMYPHFSVGLARFSLLGPVELIVRYEQTTDEAAREKIAQDLEQLLLDRAVIIPLFFQN